MARQLRPGLLIGCFGHLHRLRDQLLPSALADRHDFHPRHAASRSDQVAVRQGARHLRAAARLRARLLQHDPGSDHDGRLPERVHVLRRAGLLPDRLQLHRLYRDYLHRRHEQAQEPSLHVRLRRVPLAHHRLGLRPRLRAHARHLRLPLGLRHLGRRRACRLCTPRRPILVERPQG